MNIDELSKIISKETGEPAYKIEKILGVSLRVIREQILKAQIIKLKNLLTIYIDVAQEKSIYDLSTNAMKDLPRRFVLKVTPSKKLKKEINAKKTY